MTKQVEQQETKAKSSDRVPDDHSNIRVDSFIKIHDPESKEIYLETRG